MRAAWRRGDEVFAEAVLPDQVAGDAARFGLHPALLDAVLHAAGLAGAGGAGGSMMVPFAWSGVVLHAAGAGVLRARLRTGQGRTLSVEAADGAGKPVITVQGPWRLRPVTAAQLRSLPATWPGRGCSASTGSRSRCSQARAGDRDMGGGKPADPYQAAAGLARGRGRGDRVPGPGRAEPPRSAAAPRSRTWSPSP